MMKNTGMKKVLLLTEGVSSYSRGIIHGVAEYSRLYGPWIFYRESLAPFYRESTRRKLISNIKAWKPDGIISRISKNVAEILELNVPLITTDDDEQIPNLPCVVSGYKATGEMAAEHLLERGFREYAYCGFDNYVWSRERGKSFYHTITQAGYNCHMYRCSKKDMKQQWEKEKGLVTNWLKSLPKPIGVMVCNDDRGQQIIEACRTSNIYVPEEIAVIGVDNDALLCDLSAPPLSSVMINTSQAGFEAAALLDKLMNGKKAKSKIIVAHPTRVFTRPSTETSVLEDKDVIEALNYIRNNASNNIQVSDVAYAVSLSRRRLLDKFRYTIGRTVTEEIKRTRIQYICQMLTETDLPINKIARKLKFTNVEHIARFFRHETGISPLAYRKKYGMTQFSKKLLFRD